MTGLKRWVPIVGTAFLLSLGLAACGEGGPEQQSQAPAAEESGDAAATTEIDPKPAPLGQAQKASRAVLRLGKNQAPADLPHGDRRGPFAFCTFVPRSECRRVANIDDKSA
jgi:hypothetical protein